MLQPKPQIVRVLRPGGRPAPSLVRLDTAGGRLLIREIDGLPGSQAAKGKGSEVALRNEEVFSLAELCAGVAIVNGGKGVRLTQASRESGMLLELQLDTADAAQTWATALQAALCGGSAAAAAAETDEEALQALLMAQELVGVQEKRLNQLEDLNSRKEQQLLQLHARLEEALQTLQDGQKTYGEQQKEIEAQDAIIAQLRSMAESRPSPTGAAPANSRVPTFAAPGGPRRPGTVAPASSPAPVRSPPVASPTEDLTPREEPAAEPNEGGSKWDPYGDSDDEEDADPEDMMALLQRAEELQQELQALGGSLPADLQSFGALAGAARGGTAGTALAAAAANARTAGAALSAANARTAPAPASASRLAAASPSPDAAVARLQLQLAAETPDGGGSASAAMAQALAMQAAPGLLDALQALSGEKSRLEAQLLDEQTTLEKQLQELHAQMAELEVLEANGGGMEADSDDEDEDDN